MRIISQRNASVITDIPYERVVISQPLTEPNKIIAWDILTKIDDIILVAEYSTREKAEKAIQMLHNCYQGALPNTIFRFPQDDEISAD